MSVVQFSEIFLITKTSSDQLKVYSLAKIFLYFEIVT